ncbi:uncharacterized protein im:7136021 isoform X2 [Electrophorus electricus]|uniref:uncharacterized protein im:7136021 isoform X2 n=1 Tax=Electrophorus electricus TaxID=8005 RepID=UPI0015CFD23F|nr:uncharacterized protein im:7136021 isoform X2 [Electrophorus electricus]
MAAFGLPEELWIHVFKFLSSNDKLNIRASCRFFKRLIDHPGMWKNSTVSLKKNSAYNSHFWRTLSIRRINSVVVVKANVKEWKQLASRLPWLISVTIDRCCDAKALETLSNFKNLKRLFIRQCRCPKLASSISLLHQLSHLGLCQVRCAPCSDIINAVSQLTNLTSFCYHESSKPIPKADLHSILRCLPNLKKLSLKMGSNQVPLPNDYLCPSQANNVSEALRGVSSLKSLTVHYRCSAEDSRMCNLKTWLSTLPVLSELNISLGYHLGTYANSLPVTVRSLSLRGMLADLKAMRKTAQRVPDLLDFHLDPCCHERPSPIAELPQLFPKLQSLEMRHHNVPEKDLLGLARLSSLKRLVVLDPLMDPESALTDLTHKLHIQTNYRVHVIHCSGPNERNSCLCAYN